jgi:hypothetical protein
LLEALFFNGFDEWIPHIHDHGLNAIALLIAELIEKLLERIGFAVFADEDHAAGQIIQYHGQVAMPFAD